MDKYKFGWNDPRLMSDKELLEDVRKYQATINKTQIFNTQIEITSLRERVSKLEEWIKNHGKGY